MKIKVVIDVPDNDCGKCPYKGYSWRETSYYTSEEKHYCKLFGNVILNQKGGKFERCVACQSCEVDDE